MKKCPYCAEEIQDEAIKCRYCLSMLAPAPGGAAAPPAAADEAIQYTHSGQRYLLGYGADFFGIWDRQAPGPPVQRSPRTDEGWRSAWLQFASWEPQHTEVALVGAGRATAPSGTSAPSQYQRAPAKANGMAVASLVLGILGFLFFGLFAVLALVFGYSAKRQIDESGGAQGGRGLAVAGITLGWVWIAFLIIGLLLISTGHGSVSFHIGR